MAGIATESPLVLRESLASSYNRLTSAGGLPKGLTFGLSARRSFGREEYMPCRKERQSLTPPCPPLNTGARTHHRVKKRGTEKKKEKPGNKMPGSFVSSIAFP